MAHTNLPIFPIGTVLLPEAILPLHIFEERYRRMLDDSRHDNPAFAIALLEPGSDTSEFGTPSHIGTACTIAGISTRPDGRSDIVVTGSYRVRIEDVDWSMGYARATTIRLEDIIHDESHVTAVYRRIQHRFALYLAALERLVRETLPELDPSRDPVRGAWIIAETLTLHTRERQRLLALETVDERLDEILRLLRRELALLVQTGAIGSTIDFPGRRRTMN